MILGNWISPENWAAIPKQDILIRCVAFIDAARRMVITNSSPAPYEVRAEIISGIESYIDHLGLNEVEWEIATDPERTLSNKVKAFWTRACGYEVALNGQDVREARVAARH